MTIILGKQDKGGLVVWCTEVSYEYEHFTIHIRSYKRCLFEQTSISDLYGNKVVVVFRIRWIFQIKCKHIVKL